MSEDKTNPRCAAGIIGYDLKKIVFDGLLPKGGASAVILSRKRCSTVILFHQRQRQRSQPYTPLYAPFYTPFYTPYKNRNYFLTLVRDIGYISYIDLQTEKEPQDQGGAPFFIKGPKTNKKEKKGKKERRK